MENKEKYDCIIIGGGLGGLTSGALLSKEGYKVLLLEQHYMVGGCATTYRRGAYRCEVGLHMYDDLYSSHTAKTFNALGIYKNIQFIEVPEFYKVVANNGTEFTLPFGHDNVVQALTKSFPHEKKGIEAYMRALEVLYHVIVKWLDEQSPLKKTLYALSSYQFLRTYKKSARDLICRYIKDKELQLILAANVPYYNENVDSCSALYFAVAQYSFMTGKGWYIQGGSQKLSNYLAKVLRSHGGAVLTSALATEIIHDKQGIKGVKYQHKGKEFIADTDRVIANTAPHVVYQQLMHLPYENHKAMAPSLTPIYIGFKNNLKNIYGERPYSTFFYNCAADLDAYNENLAETCEERTFSFTDYAQIDAGLTPPDKSFGVILSMGFMNEWSGLTEREYQEKKSRIAQAYFKSLSESYPDIEEYIDFYEVGTPRTLQHYIKTPEGTPYGYKVSPDQMLNLSPIKSKEIDGLYFSGSWVIGSGYSMAIASGRWAAEKFLKDKKRKPKYW